MPKPKRESPRKGSEPKTNETQPETKLSRKRSRIAILDDKEIEEFQRKQVANDTVKGTDSAVRRRPVEALLSRNTRYEKK